MADKTARGRFVWHELIVPDAGKAHEFYSTVVGWKTQPFAEDPTYQMFVAGSPLGGSVVDSSTPPHWLPYIGTTDIEATVRRAGELGGTIEKPVAPIPNGGRWARIKDPQGASFAVHQSPVRPPREKPAKRGEFSWHELATTDFKAAFEFYSALFGWEKTGEADMGPELGTYFMFGRNGAPLGGMFNLTPQMQGGPMWTGYIRVRDINKAVKKAKRAGATLINGPMEVPGGDWIAQFLDSQGAMFALHALQADIAPAQPAAAAPAPAQGTLDFPPVDSAGLEKVSVEGQKQAASSVVKSGTAKSSAPKAGTKRKQPKSTAGKKSAPKPSRPVAKAKSSSKKKAAKKRPAATKGKRSGKAAVKRAKVSRKPQPKRSTRKTPKKAKRGK